MNINDLIPFLGENKKEIKIHFATGSNDEFEPQKNSYMASLKNGRKDRIRKILNDNLSFLLFTGRRMNGCLQAFMKDLM